MLWPIKHVFIASRSTSLTLWTTFILTEESKVLHCSGSLRMEASWALCFFHLSLSHLQSVIQATEEQLWNCSSPWHESRASGDRGTLLIYLNKCPERESALNKYRLLFQAGRSSCAPEQVLHEKLWPLPTKTWTQQQPFEEESLYSLLSTHLTLL